MNAAASKLDGSTRDMAEPKTLFEDQVMKDYKRKVYRRQKLLGDAVYEFDGKIMLHDYQKQLPLLAVSEPP